jgi:hypothetical protein
MFLIWHVGVHLFYIGPIDPLQANFIKYIVQKVWDLDQRKNFLSIYCSVLGSFSSEANNALLVGWDWFSTTRECKLNEEESAQSRLNFILENMQRIQT